MLGARRASAIAAARSSHAAPTAAAATRSGSENPRSELELDDCASTHPITSTGNHRGRRVRGAGAEPGRPRAGPSRAGSLRGVRTRRPTVLLLAGVGLAAVALGGCGFFDRGSNNRGSSEQGREVFDLWRGSVIAALVVGVLVWGLILWAAVRYRRRSDEIPTQRQYIVPLEIVYTALPILIVAVLFGFAYQTQRDVDAVSPNPDLVIDVDGFQWQWQFRYVEEEITVTGVPDEPPVMVLPVNQTVRLRLQSNDVIHSFYVPDFLYKRDVIPGVDNEIDVDVLDVGRYTGRCAEFCGLDHSKMTFVVEAVTMREFRAWVDEQQAAVSAANGGDANGGDDGGGVEPSEREAAS
jgi:cytochrome c oxidase subunit 2